MDIKRFLKRLDKTDRAIDRVVDLVFISFAAAFGAWLAWVVFADVGIGLWTHIAISLIAAMVCAVLMWLFWTLATFLL